MTTINDTNVNVNRLLELGRWLTREERKRRLGHDSEWNQDVWIDTNYGNNVETPAENLVAWSCGTACCAAGRIALEDGGMPAFFDRHAQDYKRLPVGGELETISDAQMFFGSRVRPIDEYAADALGLTDDQADRLFAGGNDWDDMVDLIGQYTGIHEDQLAVLIGATDMPEEPDDEW